MLSFLPSTPDKEKEEYKNVDTLLFFVGYSRSRHTLLASLLDGHPHMVVANEKNLFYRLRQGGEFKRNEMFDMLVQGSKGFLKGGKGMIMSGNLQNTTHFGFWMDGYWQGAYDQYIQVSLNAYASTVGNYVLRTLNCRESTSHTVNSKDLDLFQSKSGNLALET